ncbi:Dimethylmenaquinone methyltransferase [Pseudomonas syringae pv. atrofaciens]|nr:Dimethylmenaquinone methyltransferase [Pseudomonas syringae pv. atrofaciens]
MAAAPGRSHAVRPDLQPAQTLPPSAGCAGSRRQKHPFSAHLLLLLRRQQPRRVLLDLSVTEAQKMSMNKQIAHRQQQLSDAVIEQYRDIAASTIGHLTDAGYLRGIRPLFEGARLVGNVVTVKLQLPDGSILRDALLNSLPGDVLVIECVGDEHCACWGELRTLAGLIKGLAGVIVSGAVTDVAALREHRLPVFSRGVSAMTTRSLGESGELNGLIHIGGVEVRPGDIAVGDDDGVFILSPQQANELLPELLGKESADRKRMEELIDRLNGRQPEIGS